jgi:two-component system, OmpR family, response regulator
MDTQESRDWSEKRIFTTGEAAEVCKVSQQTIIRCFDSGRLTGFRVPGSKFRRIPREELVRFMKENNIPTTLIEGEVRRILVVDDDPAVLSLIRDMLSRDGRFEVETAGTGYEAGMLTESFRPHALLLDYMLPDINGNIVCQRIRTSPFLKDTRILIISGVVRQDEVRGLLDAGADDFLKKPFSIRELVQRLEKLLAIDPRDEAAASAPIPLAQENR